MRNETDTSTDTDTPIEQRQRLLRDAEGDLWLATDDRALLLGFPREELYALLPIALWPGLEACIAARRDEEQFARDCRAEVDAAYEMRQI